MTCGHLRLSGFRCHVHFSAPASRQRHSSLPRFLIKLAKHLALLVCLAIVGQATGRAAFGQLTILLLAVVRGVDSCLGQSVKWRSCNEFRAAP